MRRLFFQLVLIVIIGTVGYLALFQRDAVISLFQKAKSTLKGYKEAKTPDEAMDYFNKAMESRDYNEAANYLDGEYAVQFRKVADKAEQLAKAIDDFRHAMEQHGIRSDKANAMLADREPFPKRLRVVDTIQKKGDDAAVAPVAVETGSQLRAVGTAAIPLKREAEQWKIVLALTPAVRLIFDDIDRNGQDYVNAINVVKNRMKTDATTKDNVAKDLEEELRKARQP
ncbi:MAG: hypothetical protein HYS12_21175 [Planctomycetes bacterium]|nr:hypothetical protein [Planctomycetota bacterium]